MPALRDRPVGIVGAGRVGTALGVALTRAGYRVVGVSARSAAARQRAGRTLPGVAILDPVEVAARAGLLLLAVSDDAIEPVTTELAAGGHLRPGQLVLHASGACGLGVLAAATQAGAVPLAVHPAMTFPGLPDDADRLVGLPFAVTTRPADRSLAQEFVRDLGGVAVWIADADRVLYHAALVLAANNLITLTAAAMQALAVAGVPDPGFVLGPVVRASLDNALRHGDAALTGPVRRGDTGTIEAHLRALRERVPELVPAYVRYALVTAGRARDAALAQADRLDRVIGLLQAQAEGEDAARGGGVSGGGDEDAARGGGVSGGGDEDAARGGGVSGEGG